MNKFHKPTPRNSLNPPSIHRISLLDQKPVFSRGNSLYGKHLESHTFSKISNTSEDSEIEEFVEVRADELLTWYKQKIQDYWENNQLRSAIRYCMKMRDFAYNEGDMIGLESAFRLLGDLYLECNDIKNAISAYKSQKGLAEYNSDYRDKIRAYMKIGHAYKLVKNYRLALINFKRMLQLAWYLDNQKYELMAYDMIGMQYFYLGDIERSKYYHERMWQGVTESKSSPMRVASTALISGKHRKKFRSEFSSGISDRPSLSMSKISLHSVVKKNDTPIVLNISRETEKDLPSPRSKSRTVDLKLLPHYAPKEGFTLPKVDRLKPAISLTNLNSKTMSVEDIIAKATSPKSETERTQTYRFLSHLSPNSSFKNFYYIAQSNVRV